MNNNIVNVFMGEVWIGYIEPERVTDLIEILYNHKTTMFVSIKGKVIELTNRIIYQPRLVVKWKEQ